MKLGDILPSPEAPEQTEPVKQDTAPDLQSLPATEEQTGKDGSMDDFFSQKSREIDIPAEKKRGFFWRLMH